MARGVRGVSIARFVARSACFDTPLYEVVDLNPLSLNTGFHTEGTFDLCNIS